MDDHHAARLDDCVHQELRDRPGIPDRLSSIVTDAVPCQLPGAVLLCFARAGPDAVTADDAIDAAVAVEFAALHQYLHAIPVTEATLAAPARDSPYAEDEVAAIIDGDWLQAAAFARVAASAGSASASRRCHAALAEGSTRCYELWERSADAAGRPSLAPLVAAAGRIGAIVAGADRSTASTVADVAHSIGEAAPVRTPAGVSTSDGDDALERASLVDDLTGVVDEPDAVVDELHTLASAITREAIDE